jgi:hypothetical protein
MQRGHGSEIGDVGVFHSEIVDYKTESYRAGEMVV